jgi:hypothetical protein
MVNLVRRVAFRFVSATSNSFYDRLPESRRPFTWSTPAPDMSGKPIEPWRVVHKPEAQALMSYLFPGPQWKDLYVDFESDLYRGKGQLWIGLRDNRDRAAHSARLEQLYNALKSLGYPTRLEHRGGGYSALYLVDDLKLKG